MDHGVVGWSDINPGLGDRCWSQRTKLAVYKTSKPIFVAILAEAEGQHKSSMLGVAFEGVGTALWLVRDA